MPHESVLRNGNVSRFKSDQEKYNLSKEQLKKVFELESNRFLYCSSVVCSSSDSLQWLTENLPSHIFVAETKKHNYSIIHSLLLKLGQIGWDKEQDAEEKIENFKTYTSAIEKFYYFLIKVPEVEEVLESQLRLPRANSVWQYIDSNDKLSCLNDTLEMVIRMAIKLKHAKIELSKSSRRSAQ